MTEMTPFNLFTEEGRTRFVNASGRYCLYALLWLLLSLSAGVGTYFLYVRGNLTPMQRVYYPQYFTSAWRSTLSGVLPLVSKSTYVVLVGETYDPRTKRSRYWAVTEDEAAVVLDDEGYVACGRDGMPRFLIGQDVNYRRVFWNRTLDGNERRYEFFRDSFFLGQTFTKMLAPSFAAFLGLFVCGLGATVSFDVRQNRRYLRGALVRGPHLLSPRRYARSFRHAQGLGIKVRPLR
jgi:hypothetical protein